jgi:type II secretory pathway predicted ATPase ExeA
MPTCPSPLTEPQLTALAKIACCLEEGRGVTLLCGPPGVGKTTVLEHLVAEMQHAGRSCCVRDMAEWMATHDPLPDIVIADNAHVACDADLARLLTRCQARRPASGLVLAGQGRLLTLVARDRRVEQAVRLRASLLPGRLADTASLLQQAAGPRFDEATVSVIHDIAAGIPADVVRLRDLAAIVATSADEGLITPDEIEAIHQRLSPIAA